MPKLTAKERFKKLLGWTNKAPAPTQPATQQSTLSPASNGSANPQLQEANTNNLNLVNYSPEQLVEHVDNSWGLSTVRTESWNSE